MRRRLRIAALLGVGAAFVGWGLLGANRGWTKTSVARTVHDSVTELDGVVYDSRFVPGVDLLAGAMLLCAGVWGVSGRWGKR